MAEKKKMLVVDGNSVLNRAFYGVKPLSTRDGRPTGAIFGFVNILMKAVSQLSPDSVAVAFDLHAPTFRHKKYPEYKAGRHETPEDLLIQMPIAKQVCEKFGYSVVSLEGYEADDIIGTCAAGSGEEYDCYILTGDRDCLQLISDTSFVMLLTNNETILFDKARFAEKYSGLTPEKLVDLKALMGDSSDNIPGVAGIGEKGALKLICEYGSLDGLYESFEDSALSEKMKEKIRAGRDSAYMSYDLAAIFCDVPLDLSLSAQGLRARDNGGLYELFSELELFSFIERFSLAPKREEETDVPCERVDYCESDTLPPLSGEVFAHPDFSEKKLYITVNGKSYLLPASRENISALFSYKHVVLYDSKPVYREMIAENIDFSPAAFDIKLAAYLCDPSAKNEPENLSGLAKKATLPESEIEKKFLLLSAMPYLYEYFSKTLAALGVLSLYYDAELPLALVLARMENEGVALDAAGLAEYNKVLAARIMLRQKNIYALAGTEFNINSPKQLSEVLYVRLGLPAVKKTKSGYSTDAETLEKLRSYHPIINEILDFRTVSKLKSTYGDGLLSALSPDGRLRTSFKNAYTQTGRLSSAEPNLQNIPIKTEEGRELRRFFVAKNDEYCLVDADYSQIELRILASLSGDELMCRTFREGGDIHTATAAQVFGVSPEEVTPLMRKSAKAVNFGIVYGISDFSLAGDIGVTKKEAASYIEGYFSKYSGVKSYLDRVCDRAADDGYATTLFGRRRYIPELSSTKKTVVAQGKRLAMNSPIQGTAADIIKLAMVKTEAALRESGFSAKLILQVHDELLVEAKKRDADRVCALLRECMENAGALSVPLTVDVKVGDSWYDAH